MKTLLKVKDPENGISCKCTVEEKHGETSVMCCNNCGLPVESFWKFPNPEKLYSKEDVLHLTQTAFVAGRSQTSFEQFKKDENL